MESIPVLMETNSMEMVATKFAELKRVSTVLLEFLAPAFVEIVLSSAVKVVMTETRTQAMDAAPPVTLKPDGGAPLPANSVLVCISDYRWRLTN